MSTRSPCCRAEHGDEPRNALATDLEPLVGAVADIDPGRGLVTDAREFDQQIEPTIGRDNRQLDRAAAMSHDSIVFDSVNGYTPCRAVRGVSHAMTVSSEGDIRGGPVDGALQTAIRGSGRS